MNAGPSFADAMISSPSTTVFSRPALSLVAPSPHGVLACISAEGCGVVWESAECGDPRPTMVLRAILMLPPDGCFPICRREMALNARGTAA